VKVGKHLAWRLFLWRQAGKLAALPRPSNAVMANRQLFPET